MGKAVRGSIVTAHWSKVHWSLQFQRRTTKNDLLLYRLKFPIVPRYLTLKLLCALQSDQRSLKFLLPLLSFRPLIIMKTLFFKLVKNNPKYQENVLIWVVFLSCILRVLDLVSCHNYFSAAFHCNLKESANNPICRTISNNHSRRIRQKLNLVNPKLIPKSVNIQPHKQIGGIQIF